MTPSRLYHPTPAEIPTYSLRGGGPSSTGYHRRIEAFTGEVLCQAGEAIWFALVAAGSNPPRLGAMERIVYELLSMGVLWRAYHREAGQGHLSGEAAGWTDHGPSTLQQLDEFARWLSETGAFEAEARALCAWQERWSAATRPAFRAALASAAQLAAWFEARSLEVLGPFTRNVDRYVSRLSRCLSGRDDAYLRRRGRSEYHLNMVGTELLNRAYRRDFRRAARRIVLLPSCMPARQGGSCQAVTDGSVARCTGCSPGCRVHQITLLGHKLGTEVVILQEDVGQFLSRPTGEGPGEAPAIVGVSCVLTNAPGGLAAGIAGIPAQGVLLDYCGCSWHWHARGIPTDVNVRRLASVLDTQGTWRGQWLEKPELALTAANGL